MNGLLERILRACGWVPAATAAREADFETELRALGGSEAQLEQWRQIALTSAKVGLVSSEEFATVVARGMTATTTRMRDLNWARGKDDDQISRRIQEIWDEA